MADEARDESGGRGRPGLGAPGPTIDAPAPAEPTLTWAEQEIVTALRRLAAAQAQLTRAEGELADASAETARRTDAEDLSRLEEIHRELVDARTRASGWFGRSARDKIPALEMAEEVVLRRLGASTYLEARARAAEAAVADTDSDAVAFARRELAAAQAEWLEVQALEVEPAAPAIDLTTAPEPVEAVPPAPALATGDELAEVVNRP